MHPALILFLYFDIFGTVSRVSALSSATAACYSNIVFFQTYTLHFCTQTDKYIA